MDLHETVYAAPIYGLGVTDSRVYFVTYYDGALLSVRIQGEDSEQPSQNITQEQGEVAEEPEMSAEQQQDLMDSIKKMLLRGKTEQPNHQRSKRELQTGGEAKEQPQWGAEEQPDQPMVEIQDMTSEAMFSIAIADPKLQPMGE